MGIKYLVKAGKTNLHLKYETKTSLPLGFYLSIMLSHHKEHKITH